MKEERSWREVIPSVGRLAPYWGDESNRLMDGNILGVGTPVIYEGESYVVLEWSKKGAGTGSVKLGIYENEDLMIVLAYPDGVPADQVTYDLDRRGGMLYATAAADYLLGMAAGWGPHELKGAVAAAKKGLEAVRLRLIYNRYDLPEEKEEDLLRLASLLNNLSHT